MLVSIHEAKTHFSKFINQALNGDEVIIAKGGKPLIRLVPYVEEAEVRVGGQLKGLMQISHDFDAPKIEINPKKLLKTNPMLFILAASHFGKWILKKYWMFDSAA